MIITMKVTVTLAVVAYCVLGYLCGQSDAFECYDCNSATSNGCGDPFSSGDKEDGCAMCSKTKVKGGDIEGVIRTCLHTATGISTGCTSGSEGGASGDVCFCDSALCNASTRASMTTALLFLMPVLIVCLKNL